MKLHQKSAVAVKTYTFLMQFLSFSAFMNYSGL